MSTTTTNGTGEINAISLHSLLLDTITFLKMGQHLHPQYINTKKTYCKLMGLQNNITAKTLLKAIQYTYSDNKMSAKFDNTIAKFEAGKFLR